MKIATRYLALCLGILLLTTSCLGDDEEIVYTSDCALLTFSLGNITYKYPTTITSSTGEDSTVTVSTTIAASKYTFTIDQKTSRVFNVDSLPYNTPLDKVVVKATASTGSTSAAVISYDKDGDRVQFSSGDTLDLTVVNTLYVYSSDAKFMRPYQLSVNKHAVDPAASNWTKTALTADIDALLARQDALAADFRAEHPADHVFAFSYPNKANGSIVRDVVVAWDDASSDAYAQVWNRLSNEGQWFALTPSDDNPYGCPRLQNLCIIRYNGDLYAFGGQSLNGYKPATAAFEKMFVSVDNGITWREHSDKLTLPADLAGYEGAFKAAVDDDGWCWIVLEDGTAWRGRKNSEK